MDDLDMHLMNAFPQANRIVREQNGRRASRDDSAINYGHSTVFQGRRMSRDDIGVNYGYAQTRAHVWNDALNPVYNPSPLRMTVSAEVYPHQDPLVACESTASPSMDEISAFSPLNHYAVQPVTSAIMPLSLDSGTIPPPVLDLADGDLQKHETIQFNNYSLSSTAGDYQYAEYDATSTPYYEPGSVGPHDISSREGTSTPEFGRRNMHLYHQHTPQQSITSP